MSISYIEELQIALKHKGDKLHSEEFNDVTGKINELVKRFNANEPVLQDIAGLTYSSVNNQISNLYNKLLAKDNDLQKQINDNKKSAEQSYTYCQTQLNNLFTKLTSLDSTLQSRLDGLSYDSSYNDELLNDKIENTYITVSSKLDFLENQLNGKNATNITLGTKLSDDYLATNTIADALTYLFSLHTESSRPSKYPVSTKANNILVGDDISDDITSTTTVADALKALNAQMEDLGVDLELSSSNVKISENIDNDIKANISLQDALQSISNRLSSNLKLAYDYTDNAYNDLYSYIIDTTLTFTFNGIPIVDIDDV